MTGPGQHEQKGEVRENMTFSIEQSLRGTDLVLTGDGRQLLRTFSWTDGLTGWS